MLAELGGAPHFGFSEKLPNFSQGPYQTLRVGLGAPKRKKINIIFVF